MPLEKKNASHVYRNSTVKIINFCKANKDVLVIINYTFNFKVTKSDMQLSLMMKGHLSNHISPFK